MIDNAKMLSMLTSPVRQVKAKVELYDGSTLLNTFSYDDRLIAFDVERTGEGKFFGFGICQRLNVKLIDTNRELNIKTANTFEIYFGDESDYIKTLPCFKVTEVNRDEETNELSITAYDYLYQASTHYTSEIEITDYSIQEYATAAAAVLGLNLALEGFLDSSCFDTTYSPVANLEGTETIREVLNAIAEATQSIYYINANSTLVFKRMGTDTGCAIDKSQYFTLKSGDNRRLQTICHATELGDNLAASITEIGSTQYIRNNPFWELRDDVATLVDNALAAVGGFTINQFECEWRGNYLIELGDKLLITTKDDNVVTSYLLDDRITYNGTYSQNTQWSYTENDTETESNSTSIGAMMKQTYAKVDKVNKQIDMVVSDTAQNTNDISSLMLNTESITATVKSIENNVNSTLDSVNTDIDELTKQVAATVTSETVKIEVKNAIANGTTRVETNTGFTLDDTGLTVEKSGSEMKTQITEDGMIVYKNDEAVLTANNVGVEAVNLHATTYLIIGKNSRFEDYDYSRTGCFWIGEVT